MIEPDRDVRLRHRHPAGPGTAPGTPVHDTGTEPEGDVGRRCRHLTGAGTSAGAATTRAGRPR